MIDQAKKDLHIDLTKSWMIGDSPADIEAGKNACLKTIKIGERIPQKKTQPDHYAANLLEAAGLILQTEG
jgi:D-glycero-D-manno-heptose 1,7-bisphosphate phosphatase